MKIGKLSILGLGLMGGSLARALKANNSVVEVVAWGRRSASLERGAELGVIDSWTLDLAEAVDGADVVVLCTPTLVAEEVLTELAPLLSKKTAENTVLTDVASVKGNILRAAERAFGRLPERFVLGHPIAGSEQSGVEAARTDLFVDHRVILTPTETNDVSAVDTIREMWECAGAEVVCMAVDEHDKVLAATSHLPHVLAYTLVDALASEGAAAEIFRFAAGGFRDFTRIASSDPKMWHDIVLANREAILQGIDNYTAHLAEVRHAIDSGDSQQLMTVFDRAKTARDEHFLGQYMKLGKKS